MSGCGPRRRLTRRAMLRGTAASAGLFMAPALGCRCSSPQAPSTPSESEGPASPVLDADSTSGNIQDAGPSDSLEPAYLRLEREGELARREERLWSMLERCGLCLRGCEMNRLAGEMGVCQLDSRLVVASAYPHHGEEAPLRGRAGSGTIFFSYCNLLCCFCINWEIAHRGDGEAIDHARLARVMIGLQRRGCHNINLVTPTHVLPHVIRALRLAIPQGLRLPIVYNTSSYEAPEVIRLLDGIVDIYLPDFKYQDGAMAARYSAQASDYPEIAAANIREMHRQVGTLQLDPSGVALRGLLVRHLVMPNNVAGTDRFVRWVARELSPDTYVNIMTQYTPRYRADEHPDIARPTTEEEHTQAMRWAREAGLTRLDQG